MTCSNDLCNIPFAHRFFRPPCYSNGGLITSETVEKPFSIVNAPFLGVSRPFIIMRSLIVPHSVKSFFSASPLRICLGTFSTVSLESVIVHFCSIVQDFERKSIIFVSSYTGPLETR